MQKNKATIYVNGIAELQRVYPLRKSERTQLSLPVRQEHLADVLGSLLISGDVALVRSPSFQSANMDDGTLSVSPSNTLVSLLEQLSGAQISFECSSKAFKGTLVGIHDHWLQSPGQPVMQKRAVVMVDGAVSHFPLEDIEGLRFLSATIQSEIDKALSRRVKQITPHSTFVDFELLADKDTTAVVQYTIPAAAWKISYRLVLSSGPMSLHGHAIVDNNTDEDWKDFQVAVVMGQPITFSSDLADSKTPHRQHVNVVQERAVGAVEVEESLAMVAMSAPPPPSAPASPRSKKKSRGRPTAMRSESFGGSPPEVARSEAAQVDEVGDFCVFEATAPVTIQAQRSAVIPVFQSDVPTSKRLLHYKETNHSERAYRSIRFRNTLGHPLGRGVCAVFEGTHFVGSCIVPALKPGGESFLPYALDTSVRVRMERSAPVRSRVAVRIEEGVLFESIDVRAETQYHLVSSGREGFDIALDHERALSSGTLEARVEQDSSSTPVIGESLKRGARYLCKIEPKGRLAVVVTEREVQKTRVEISANRLTWLVQTVGADNQGLLQNPTLVRCMQIQSSITKVQQELAAAQQRVQSLSQRQERLRQNLSVQVGEAQSQRWQQGLAQCEDELVRLEESAIPGWVAQEQSLNQQLHAELKRMAFHWDKPES